MINLDLSDYVNILLIIYFILVNRLLIKKDKKIKLLYDIINLLGCPNSNVLEWNKFPESKPNEYGKYLISRKDGKIHWETWNTSGWAYNHNEIKYWLTIPKTPQNENI